MQLFAQASYLQDRFLALQAFSAVSYTHLDVYKRQLPDGGAELGGGVRVNVAENALAQTGRYQAHRRFIDLQRGLEGSEAMEWAPLDELSGGGYDEARDIEFFEGEPAGGAALGLTAGMFAIFYPQDAHKPGLRHRPARARKAVFKIPV